MNGDLDPAKNPHTSRQSHVELPAGDEIMHISDAEDTRIMPPERQNVHYPNFGYIKRIYDYFDIDTAIYNTPDLTAEHILDSGGATTDQLVAKLLVLEVLPAELVELLQQAYEYLAEEDQPQPSDYIYVFGAKTPLRAQKAIELYRQHLAPKIIFSGKGPFYGKSEDETEAAKYAAIAEGAGVPTDAMIIEDASITIPDNVRRTLNMMDDQGMSYNSFIIVNSPYTQRRGWCVWKKHTPDSVDIYRVNCPTGPNFAPDIWYKNEDGLKVVLGEFVKLRNTVAFNDA